MKVYWRYESIPELDGLPRADALARYRGARRVATQLTRARALVHGTLPGVDPCRLIRPVLQANQLTVQLGSEKLDGAASP